MSENWRSLHTDRKKRKEVIKKAEKERGETVKDVRKERKRKGRANGEINEIEENEEKEKDFPLRCTTPEMELLMYLKTVLTNTPVDVLLHLCM